MGSLVEWSVLAVSAGVLALAGCKSGGQTAHGDAGIDRPGDTDADGALDPDAPAASDAVTEAGFPADATGDATPAATCRAAIEAQCRRQAACRGGDVDPCVSTVV